MRWKEIFETGVPRRLIKAVPNSTVKLFASEVFLTARAASGLFSRRLDFLIVGAQKAGTTALFEMLTRNRLISLSIKKEVHYFDRHYDRGEGWYLSHFIDRQLPIGEATPAYLFDPLSIQRIRTDFAPLKLIVCIRDATCRDSGSYFEADIPATADLIRRVMDRHWVD